MPEAYDTRLARRVITQIPAAPRMHDAAPGSGTVSADGDIINAFEIGQR